MAKMWHSGRLTITVEDHTGEYDDQELQIAAIVELIDSAPSSFWEKDALNEGQDSPTPAFYEAILTAVANHAAVDREWLEGKPVYEALYELIGELREDGHLHEPTVGMISDEDEGDNE